MLVVGDGILSKKQRNAPDGSKSDKCVDYSAYDACLSAAEPCDDIKLKNTDTAPIKAADDKKNK